MRRFLSLAESSACIPAAIPSETENWHRMGATELGREYYLDLDSVTLSGDGEYVNYIYAEMTPSFTNRLVSVQATCSPRAFSIVWALTDGEYLEGTDRLQVTPTRGTVAEAMLTAVGEIIGWNEPEQESEPEHETIPDPWA